MAGEITYISNSLNSVKCLKCGLYVILSIWAIKARNFTSLRSCWSSFKIVKVKNGSTFLSINSKTFFWTAPVLSSIFMFYEVSCNSKSLESSIYYISVKNETLHFYVTYVLKVALKTGFITACQRSRRNVMFSVVCVCLFTWGWGSHDRCTPVETCSLGIPQTCSNLFTWESGWLAFDWKAFLLSMISSGPQNLKAHESRQQKRSFPNET